MSQHISAFYKGKIVEYSTELARVSNKLKRFAWYRFLAFIFIFVPFFTLNVISWGTYVISAVFLISFFYLIKRNLQLERQKNKLKFLVEICEDESLALQHKFSHFYNGKEFLDTNHFFSYDLDLFGEGSVFQFINRTVTKSGLQKLAGWFIKPEKKKQIIEIKQKAIRELSQIPSWRLNFLANGKQFKESLESSREIKNWSEMELEFNKSGLIKYLIYLIPGLTVLAILPAAIGFSNFILVLLVFVQWFLVYLFWSKTSLYFKFFGRKSELLEKYMQLLNFIENREFQSEYLLELQGKVKSPNSASKIFMELKSLVKEFEYRQNMLVGFILNSVLLWDLRCDYKLWRWHTKNHKKMAVWLDVIAEFDALISLANYANNNADFTYPEIHEGGFTFQGIKLGHPLLHPKKSVANNLEIKGWSKVTIVTGANMAGKSTFLRTVGVNLILGRTGAPVCAKKLVLTPIDIYTNMRTTDSLLKDESYFFAELKRIKGVLDRLENGEQIFVILDEMLKGTNSIDKFNGSKELIKKLVKFKSVSLIATHDLKLSELQNDYPQQVNNKCFEIRIENNELIFDYLLSDGVTKTMNATFLMKKMGII